jgi:hypothetical protein
LECPAFGGVVANPVGQTFLSKSKDKSERPTFLSDVKKQTPDTKVGRYEFLSPELYIFLLNSKEQTRMSVLPTDKPVMPEADPPQIAGERFILQFS